MDPNQIIKRVLEIIDYQGDKELLTKNLMEACQVQAVKRLVDRLPEDKKAQFEDAGSDPSPLAESLRQTFSEEETKEALRKASEKVFADYLNTLIPTLSESQKSSLDSYLNTLS